MILLNDSKDAEDGKDDKKESKKSTGEDDRTNQKDVDANNDTDA